ncbi:MAG: riboflavin synthase [Pseudomonadota bacterium]|nr:riboflavin synthase [Pseudomonadota bacterium]
MFTGLIQAVGQLATRDHRGGDQRLRMTVGALPVGGLQVGESIAVNGVCLTVVAFDAEGFSADVSNETLARTTLGILAHGAAVNLERAMLPTTRIGGHFVAGHVDAVGRVASIDADGRGQRWRFTVPEPLLRYVAAKGSIAVDGVSLTVNDVSGDRFGVMLVPHTVAHTAFAHAAVGNPVNLEVDLVARYVERLLDSRESRVGSR